MQIDVSFQVFKALTALRESEETSYSDVVEALLAAARPSERVPVRPVIAKRPTPTFAPAGRPLPDGTHLLASYKGKKYSADVRDGVVHCQDGEVFKSLSAAAKHITGNNVNGLLFWKVRRPQDRDWLVVPAIPREEK